MITKQGIINTKKINENHEPIYGATPTQAIGRFFLKYFIFNGRASRSEYWCVFFFLLLASIPVSAIDIHVKQGALIVFWGCTLIPFISLTFRRFHDFGLSGAYILILVVPPIGPFALLGMMAIPENEEGSRKYP